jgi:hypothetical protein
VIALLISRFVVLLRGGEGRFRPAGFGE